MSTRKIADLDRLADLPVGSVVMEGATGKPRPWFGGVSVMPGIFHRFPDGWYVVAGVGPRVPDFAFGPLTVLHIPRGL